ncbi:helix-turn-helix transcriptional regulator [Oceanobacillus sp. FSL W8-0428]|uniref:helix-turn-helix transcriptional regulator n=1 Tax=Oceanobacillus TaxID=182709 RepID=UPI0021A86A75|nr:helix-turn-helix transcriptional regulator [Oceanobacillus sojae]MCT1902964.1 helix-turn-helix transcriptional regulator [Oceanobacillus sojae]
MEKETRLLELSNFLKSKRAKLHPQMVGLPAGTRRRTPGLRREEVAQIAGVSTTWYTWLEQGRDIKVSGSVLDAVSNALRLNKDEKQYLYALASGERAVENSSTINEAEKSLMTPSLNRILQELRHCPTIISDKYCRIVGWNKAAAMVFIDFEKIPEEDRNIIFLLFSRKEFKSLAVNWEHFVKGYLSIFRSYYGQYVADEWYKQFIEKMEQQFPEFKKLWDEEEVSSAPDVLIEFRHAKAGKMLFNLTSLQVQGTSDLRCSVYTPVMDTDTELKLRNLLNKSAGK